MSARRSTSRGSTPSLELATPTLASTVTRSSSSSNGTANACRTSDTTDSAVASSLRLEDDGVLVTAEPGDGGIGRDATEQPVRDHLQQRVPGVVPGWWVRDRDRWRAHRLCGWEDRSDDAPEPARRAARRPSCRTSRGRARRWPPAPTPPRSPPTTRRPAWPGPCWPRRRWPTGAPSRATPTRAPATTAGWTSCAAAAGRAPARSPGSTSRTGASCGRCTRSARRRRPSGEDDEAARCAQFLADSSPQAVRELS